MALTEKQKAYFAAWRAKQPKKERPKGKTGAQLTKEHRHRRRAHSFKLKKEGQCKYCDLKNPLCLDWDHIDRTKKRYVPGIAIGNGTKWEEVLKELENCQLVCANCHRMKSILEAKKLMDMGEDILQYMPQKLLEEFGYES